MFATLSGAIAEFIYGLAQTAQTFAERLYMGQYAWWQIFLDIILVAILFYWIMMWVRETRAMQILIGLIVLALLYLASKTLELLALNWLLERLMTVILVAIPIIFQQELRRGLEKLGQTKWFSLQRKREVDLFVREIINATNTLSQDKIGALIVFKNTVNLKEYTDTGVPINGKVTKELLLSLFYPGSSLHDGAVIIEDRMIKAAGCTLPHAIKEYGHEFGTRHKSALALSEITDAGIVVVSEERKMVSWVQHGHMHRNVTPEKLHELLIHFFQPTKKLPKVSTK